MQKVSLLYSKTKIKRTPPANLRNGDDVFFGKAPFEQELPDSYLVYFRNAKVTDLGVIISNWLPHKQFITCYESDFKNYRLRYALKTLLFYKNIKTDESKKYLLIFDNYSGPKGFFHWIADSLSRLVELKDQIANYTVIIPEYFKREVLYQDTLKFFNIKDSVYVSSNTCLEIRHLYVANYIGSSGIFRPENVTKLKHHIWEQLGLPLSGNPSDKIYISRKNAARRYVENEDEIVRITEQMGFRTIYLEEYSFEEQVRLVYNAKQMISIHGAALTHIWFMLAGSKVLEFRREGDMENDYYYSLASASGVSYYYIFCKANEISLAGNNFNLRVDPEELKKVIQEMSFSM